MLVESSLVIKEASCLRKERKHTERRAWGIRNQSSQPLLNCPRLGEYAEFDGSSKLGSYGKWHFGGFMHRRG